MERETVDKTVGGLEPEEAGVYEWQALLQVAIKETSNIVLKETIQSRKLRGRESQKERQSE